jgi:hypothetical protein
MCLQRLQGLRPVRLEALGLLRPHLLSPTRLHPIAASDCCVSACFEGRFELLLLGRI